MAKVVITLDTPDSAANIRHALDFGGKTSPDRLLDGVLKGRINSLSVQHQAGDAAAASKVVALSTCVAGDILLINGVSFTAVAAGATGNQFNIGGSDTLTAAALAAAINASSTALVSGVVKATSSGANLTVTAITAGALGNNISLECRGSGGLAISGSGAQASGTITFSGTGQANDTVLINGVTFTAVAAGATGNQWNVGASATASAANLVTAINASATALVTGCVFASSNAGVVTIKAQRIGTFGNTFTIAEGVDGLTHMAVSGARLTGGTDNAVMYLASGSNETASTVHYNF